MTHDQQHRTPAGSGRRRRTFFVAGVAGASAVLAGAGFLMNRPGDGEQTSRIEPVAIAPAQVESAAAPSLPASPSSSPPAATSAPTSAAATRSPTPAPTATESRKKKEKNAERAIAEARASAASDGVELKRPLKAKSGAAAPRGSVDERTEEIRGGTMQVSTARFDLTGYPQMLRAGGKGRTVADGVRCTDKVRFSEGMPAIRRPTVLMCWRVSAQRSVVTFAATPDAKPSASEIVAVIAREWKKLG